MERSQLFDLMGELKLYGMKAAFDEIMATLASAPLMKQRGAPIGEGKDAKLLRIEPPIAVVADDAVDHHKDAKRIGAIDEAAQRLVPARDFLALLEIEPERACRQL